MNKEQRKLAVLDAIRDDAYELAELWSLERGDGIPEQSAREATRENLLELADLGLVKFTRELAPGRWQDLTRAESERLRDDLRAWGLGAEPGRDLSVTLTPSGEEAAARRQLP
jgi:hypothetical protein